MVSKFGFMVKLSEILNSMFLFQFSPKKNCHMLKNDLRLSQIKFETKPDLFTVLHNIRPQNKISIVKSVTDNTTCFGADFNHTYVNYFEKISQLIIEQS